MKRVHVIVSDFGTIRVMTSLSYPHEPYPDMRLYSLDHRTSRRLILIVYRGSSALHSTCIKNAPNTRRPGDEQYVLLYRQS